MRISRDNIKILLIILVLGLGLGYAYINSDLNINGTAQVNSANWDVHWANIQVTNGSVSGANVVTAPTISNQTTVNYSIILDKPGDYYEFTVDAVNGGTIDAMIDSIDSKLNGVTVEDIPDYLDYEITYSDGGKLSENHLLAANSTETYKVRIKYRDDIELNQIPASNQTLNLQFKVIYRQANNDAIDLHFTGIKYTADSYATYVGERIPSNILQFSSASEAINNLKDYWQNEVVYYCNRHILQDGIVVESQVEFIITPEIANSHSGMTVGTYLLRTADIYDYDEITGETNCKSEYYDTTKDRCVDPYLEANKATLMSAFGSSNCTNSHEGIYYDELYCRSSELEAHVKYDDISVGVYYTCACIVDQYSKWSYCYHE